MWTLYYCGKDKPKIHYGTFQCWGEKVENDLDLFQDFSQKYQIKDQDHQNDLDHFPDQITFKNMI